MTEGDLAMMGVRKLGERKRIIKIRTELVVQDLNGALAAKAPLTPREVPEEFTGVHVVSEKPRAAGQTAFHRKLQKKFGVVLGGLTVGWESFMNVVALNPVLHLISMLPIMVTAMAGLQHWFSM
eukprot:GEMP01030126.1.p3 GENE.GEMP01030126.1~~GEMP01030126.1.p3  ORF type:complete len:124 (+),score=32.96 GEMP01030126.1:405-776(+)